MQTLINKHIVLGITGSIAAYKSGDLVRRLRDAGAEVRVVMTHGATEFVTPLTFQALSGHPVHQAFLDVEAEAAMGHIELARWADAILIAPASADFMARLAQGRADDLLSAICLAANVPLALAPAMNHAMWANPATQENVRSLSAHGIVLFGPDHGEQACGEVGEGRMLEVAELVEQLSEVFQTGSLTGKTVIVTAGPTREAIDPVRYLTNHSSGKMGYAIAAAAAEAGARVILISGPTDLNSPLHVEMMQVESAQQMYEVVQDHLHEADIFVGAAAVADYRPRQIAKQKVKKGDSSITLELERTPDILASIKPQRPSVFTVGFAAETANLAEHALKKLTEKQLDMIAANLVGQAAEDTAGTFGSDTNSLQIFWPGGELAFPVTSKTRLARELITLIAERLVSRTQTKQNEDLNKVVAFNSRGRES